MWRKKKVLTEEMDGRRQMLIRQDRACRTAQFGHAGHLVVKRDSRRGEMAKIDCCDGRVAVAAFPLRTWVGGKEIMQEHDNYGNRKPSHVSNS